MSGTLVRAGLAVICAGLLKTDGTQHRRWIVETPADLPTGTRLAVEDLKRDLARLNTTVDARPLTGGGCAPGQVQIAVVGHTHDDRGRPAPSPLGAQEYTIDETRSAGGGPPRALGGRAAARAPR